MSARCMIVRRHATKSGPVPQNAWRSHVKPGVEGTPRGLRTYHRSTATQRNSRPRTMIQGSPTRRPAWQHGAARFAPIGRRAFACVLAVAVLAVASGPAAARDIYTFKIEHPTLGDIGSYTD